MNDSSYEPYRHTVQWVIAISLKVAPNEFGSSNEGKTERNFFHNLRIFKTFTELLSEPSISVYILFFIRYSFQIPLHFIESWDNT